MVEQLERFATQPGAEIHLYAQRVEDVANAVRYPAPSPSAGCIVWHKVPRIRGPHLFGYAWWFLANHLQRWWDAKVRGLKCDLLYSAGVNALDADAIAVHVVFAEFYRRVRSRMRFREAPITLWPVILHRRLYYSLICILEKKIYPRKRTALAAISQHTSKCIGQFFGRDDVCVIRHGVDTQCFDPVRRLARRNSARASLQIRPTDACLLLIGNDWKSKGLDTLLQALKACSELPFLVLVVGADDRRGYAGVIRSLGLDGKVRFLDPSSDVMEFYAASDVYVGPSLEDAYGLPVLEAMACGLPVVVSARAGASEIVRHGENGLVLRDPENSHELASLLRRLYADAALREKLAEEAARTAAGESWDRNAAATWEFLNALVAKNANE